MCMCKVLNYRIYISAIATTTYIKVLLHWSHFSAIFSDVNKHCDDKMAIAIENHVIMNT